MDIFVCEYAFLTSRFASSLSVICPPQSEGFEFICYMAALKEVEDAFWAEFDDFPDTFPAIARTDSAVVRSEKLQARFVFVRQQLEDSVSSAMK